MIQFYFLSVLLNSVGGFALAMDASGREGKRPSFPALDSFKDSLRDPTLRLVIGILTAVTGAFKLLTVVRGDIPVVGDFLPAAAGMAVGASLLVELYRSEEGAFGKGPEEGAGAEAVDGKAAEEARSPAKATSGTQALEGLLLRNKAAIGYTGLIAALIHFLFPAVLFL